MNEVIPQSEHALRMSPVAATARSEEQIQGELDQGVFEHVTSRLTPPESGLGGVSPVIDPPVARRAERACETLPATQSGNKAELLTSIVWVFPKRACRPILPADLNVVP